MEIRSTIINKWNKESGIGKKSLEALVEELMFEVSNMKVENVNFCKAPDKSLIAMFAFVQDPEKEKFLARLTDVSCCVKGFGYEKYDEAWRKKLLSNLISQEDKEFLSKEFSEYAGDLEARTK